MTVTFLSLYNPHSHSLNSSVVTTTVDFKMLSGTLTETQTSATTTTPETTLSTTMSTSTMYDVEHNYDRPLLKP